MRTNNVATHLLRNDDAVAPIGQYTHMNKTYMTVWMTTIKGFAHPNNSVAITAAQDNKRGKTYSHTFHWRQRLVRPAE
jgi:hypothetical protein